MSESDIDTVERLARLARDVGRWQSDGEYDRVYAAYRAVSAEADGARGTTLRLLEVAQAFLRLAVPGRTPRTEQAHEYATKHGPQGIELLLAACTVSGATLTGEERDLVPLFETGLLRRAVDQWGTGNHGIVHVTPSLVGPVRSAVLGVLWDHHTRGVATDALAAWRRENDGDPSACQVPAWLYRTLGLLGSGGRDVKLLGYPAVAGGESIRFI